VFVVAWTHPGRVQAFLSRGAWDAEGLARHVRDLIVEEMADPDRCREAGIPKDVLRGFEHTLLIRRSIADPSEVGYFLVHAPAATTVTQMVSGAGIRWRIEECNEQSKDLLGLDQYQVRTWAAFHHHVALCAFAHAFAATRRAHQQRLATTRRVLAAHAGEEVGEGAGWGNEPTAYGPTTTACTRPAGSSGARSTAPAPRSVTTTDAANSPSLLTRMGRRSTP
jgi:hypothetical protein